MNMKEALSVACSCLEVRRRQWEGVAVPDHCMDGDPSDLIPELYEADPEEARAMVKLMSDAAATLFAELEKYRPGGE